jgi:O-antigen/teichoic acid export membrane protein
VLGLRLAVQAGSLLLLARLLGPRQFGAFAGVAALAVLLGTLSTFGTHLVLLGEMSKDPAQRAQVLPYALPTTLLCGGILLAVYMLLCMFWLNVTSIIVAVLLAIGIAEVVLQPLLILATSELHATGRIAGSQWLQMLPMVFRLALLGILSIWKPAQALPLYAAGYVAASGLALIYGWTQLPQPWPWWNTWRLPGRAELRHAVGYAAINVSKAGPAELDKTLALRLLAHDAAGVYAAGARVVGAITLPVTAMTLSALPRLFREGSRSDSKHLLAWMYGAAVVYSLTLAVLIWLAAPAFVFLFGARYAGMDAVIRVLCLAVPAIALRLVAGNALMALGTPWMRVAFEATGLLVLAIASVLLVNGSNSQPLPLALVCAEWTMALLGCAFVLIPNSTAPNKAHYQQ